MKAMGADNTAEMVSIMSGRDHPLVRLITRHIAALTPTTLASAIRALESDSKEDGMKKAANNPIKLDSREGVEMMVRWAKAHNIVLGGYYKTLAGKYGVSLDGVAVCQLLSTT